MVKENSSLKMCLSGINYEMFIATDIRVCSISDYLKQLNYFVLEQHNRCPSNCIFPVY